LGLPPTGRPSIIPRKDHHIFRGNDYLFEDFGRFGSALREADVGGTDLEMITTLPEFGSVELIERPVVVAPMKAPAAEEAFESIRLSIKLPAEPPTPCANAKEEPRASTGAIATAASFMLFPQS
jgi:hypothetical protein